MNRNYFFGIVIAAIVCLFLIFFSLWREIESPVTKEPLFPPPKSPYKTYISGEGVIEASSENIQIGSPMNRIVSQVLVKVGQKVKKGDPLIQLDDQDLKADLMSQKAAYKSAQARLQKLEAMPRKEDLSNAEATAKGVKLELDAAKKQYDMVLELPDQRAISQQEKDRRYLSYQQAEAKWQQAQAELEKVKMGAWQPDLDIARFEMQQAEANVKRLQAELQRTNVRAPIDGTVLQIRVHEGEASPMNMPLMVIGNTDDLFVRVSINQLDVPMFDSKNPAVAFLQGDSRYEFPLEFVKVEPLLTNKQNSTNEITARTDTRVLHIIYRIKKIVHPVYVGQQMDVYIQTNLEK